MIFPITVVQGVVISCPWSALSFVSMWLELIWFSHEEFFFFMDPFVVVSSLSGLPETSTDSGNNIHRASQCSGVESPPGF